MQLVDDFVAGAIIFDGDAGTIASLVAELSSYAYFRRTEAHLTVLKLLAAFPRGCPLDVAKRYGVLPTFQEVTAELRGEIVTLLPEGYALIDLQRVGKPVDKLGLILKKYWMQITDAEVDEDETCRRFAQHVLPQLFPTATDRVGGWVATSPLDMFADGTYRQSFKGSLHDRHPERRVRIILCCSQSTLLDSEADEEHDFTLVLTLATHADCQAERAAMASNRIDFCLDMARIPEAGLPPELRVVEHNLSPQPPTPAALLNVIEFVTREMTNLTLTLPERQRFDRLLERMREWVLKQTFSENILGAVDPEAATPGQRGMRDLLFRECERRYPRYRTMITSGIWRQNIAVYRQALAAVSLSQRRGIEPVVASKAALAALFGQRSHAGFESKVRVQYPNLLDITSSGEQGTLLFRAHPMEAQVLARLGNEGQTREDAVAVARAEGYTREEADELLNLLVARGQIREDGTRICKDGNMTAAEMRRLGTAIQDELQAFQYVLGSEDTATERELEEAVLRGAADDEEDLVRAHSQLLLLMERMSSLRARAREQLIAQLDFQRGEVTDLLRSLDAQLAPCMAEVAFHNHLEGARKQLEEARTSAQRTLSRLRENIQQAREDTVRMDNARIGQYLGTAGNDLARRNSSLAALRLRVQEHLNRFDCFHRCSAQAERLERLQGNVRELVRWSDANDLSVSLLAQRLAALEGEARERLAHDGLRVLDQFGRWIHHELDELAQEYERSFREREAAFEREKADLELLVGDLMGSKHSLVSKYQASKHAESYRDLYAEVAGIAASTVRACLHQAQYLVDGTPPQHLEGPPKGKAKRVLAACIRELTAAEQSLRGSDWSSTEARTALREEMLARIAQNIVHIRESLAQWNSQADLWAEDGKLAMNVTPSPRDIATLLDLQEALSLLPPASPLGILLRLCLDGDCVMEVRKAENPNR